MGNDSYKYRKKLGYGIIDPTNCFEQNLEQVCGWYGKEDKSTYSQMNFSR